MSIYIERATGIIPEGGYSPHPSLVSKEPSRSSSKLSLPHRTTTDVTEVETIVQDKQFFYEAQCTFRLLQ